MLSQVCTHWKSIVRHTSALWTNIFPSSGLDFVRISIQKSEMLLLTYWIDYRHLSNEGEPSEANQQEWFDVLSPGLLRCSSVRFSNVPGQAISLFDRCISSYMPKLATLSIRRAIDSVINDDDLPENLFDSGHPQLRRLSLEKSKIPINLFRWESLTEMVLHRVSYMSHLILCVLQLTPLLENLSVSYEPDEEYPNGVDEEQEDQEEDRDEEEPKDERPSLYKLHTVELCMHPSLIRDLLPHLDAPFLRQLIWRLIAPPTPEQVRVVLRAATPIVKSLAGYATILRQGLDPHQLSLRITPGGPSPKHSTANPADDLIKFQRSFDPTKPRPRLQFDIASFPDYDGDEEETPTPTPDITSLELDAAYKATVSQLSRPLLDSVQHLSYISEDGVQDASLAVTSRRCPNITSIQANSLSGASRRLLQKTPDGQHTFPNLIDFQLGADSAEQCPGWMDRWAAHRPSVRTGICDTIM